MLENANQSPPSAVAAASVLASIEPLRTALNSQIQTLSSSQKSLQSKLDTLLQTVKQTEQASHQNQQPLLLRNYITRIEGLRGRIDSLGQTTTRIQVRLESLQEAITRHEKIQSGQSKNPRVTA